MQVLTILQLEGLGSISNTTCNINLDHKEISSHSLKTLPVSSEIPGPGIVHLNILDNDSQVQIVSLSFHTSLLKSDNLYWCPLFLSPKNYLNSIPTSISSPKILIACSNSSNPYNFLTNSTENLSFDTESEVIPLESKLSDYPTLQSELKTCKKTIKTLQLDLIQCKKSYKQKSKFYVSQISSLTHQLESEKSSNLALKSQLDRCHQLLSNFHSSISEFFPNTQPSLNTLKPDSKSFMFESYLDSQVRSTLKRLNFEGLLHRCRDLNYKVGSNKTITVTVKQGKLFCHDTSFEKYIFHNCKQEIEDLLRQRTRPLSSSPLKSPVKRFCQTPVTRSQKQMRFNI